MNTTLIVSFRSRLRDYLIKHELLLRRLLRAASVFFCLWVIRNAFGYSSFLGLNWVILAVAIACAFVPMSVGALALAVYILLQLLALAPDIAGMTLLLFALAYLFGMSYQAKQVLHLAGVTPIYQLHIPFLAPLWGGLFGGMQEVTMIIGGSTISYYLKMVRDSSPELLGTDEPISALQILQSMFASPMFFIYLVSMVAMFVIVCFVRSLPISHSWLLASFLGVLAEFIIMTGGYLFIGGQEHIPELIVADLILLAGGAILSFIFQDLDFTRVERVQFEDDDYYYYVRAVPKIHLAAEEKQVTRITGDDADDGKGEAEEA